MKRTDVKYLITGLFVALLYYGVTSHLFVGETKGGMFRPALPSLSRHPEEPSAAAEEYSGIAEEPSEDKGLTKMSDAEAEAIVAAGEPADESKAGETTAGQMVKKEEPVEKALIQKGGVLLKKGTKQIENSFTYAHVSANKITLQGYTIFPVLVVGEINSQEVKRDIFIETLGFRYGLTNDLQLQVSAPFRAQFDRETIGTTSETTRNSSGFGDVEAGIFHQFAYEKGGRPDMICGLSVKAPTGREPYNNTIGTGTGHWAVKGSVVAVKSADPAILFGKFGYTYNMKRDDIENYGTIEPGQSFDYGLGVAFALNYQLALSASFEQSLTTKMIINHNSQPGSFSNVVNFKYGFTWSVNKKLSCDVSASHGLTPDAPNFVLEVRVPYKF